MGTKERAAQLLKDRQYPEAIKVLKRLILYGERRLRQGKERMVDSWPYRALASIYRKQRNFELEQQTLVRFASIPPMPGGILEDFSNETSMRIARHRLFGPEGKGQCQICGKWLVLEKNDLDEWLCSKCRKIRQREIQRRRCLQQLREWGLTLPDETTGEQLQELMTLHSDVARYVGSVWYHLTGLSTKFAVNVGTTSMIGGLAIRFGMKAPLPEFDRFVSTFLVDHSLALRLARVERERTAYATARLTPDQQSDPYKYVHIIRGKPPLVKDNDYQFVVKKLYEHYGRYICERSS